MAGPKFLFTLHEIHKHQAARGVLWDGDEPGGAADERSEAAKQHKKRDLQKAIEVNFNQLFLIRHGSWDQPWRYVPPERLRFYKQPSPGSWADRGPPDLALWGSPMPRRLHGLASWRSSDLKRIVSGKSVDDISDKNPHIWAVLPRQISFHFGS